MKNFILIVALTVLVTGCAGMGKQVNLTPWNVYEMLEEAVDAFEGGDLYLAEELLCDALARIPRHNLELRRRVLISIGYVYFYNDKIESMKAVSKKLNRIDRELDDKKLKRDPHSAFIHAVVSVNSNKPATAAKIIKNNSKLARAGIKNLLIEEVK